MTIDELFEKAEESASHVQAMGFDQFTAWAKLIELRLTQRIAAV